MFRLQLNFGFRLVIKVIFLRFDFDIWFVFFIVKYANKLFFIIIIHNKCAFPVVKFDLTFFQFNLWLFTYCSMFRYNTFVQLVIFGLFIVRLHVQLKPVLLFVTWLLLQTNEFLLNLFFYVRIFNSGFVVIRIQWFRLTQEVETIFFIILYTVV